LGADRVYAMEDPALAEYQPEAYTAAVTAAVQVARPAAVLLGHTVVGRDLAPRVAFRLGAGLATDCVALYVEDGALRATKPVYGGKVMATVAWEGEGPRVATLRVKVADPAPPQPGRAAPVVALDVPPDLGAGPTRILERRRVAAEGQRLR